MLEELRSCLSHCLYVDGKLVENPSDEQVKAVLALIESDSFQAGIKNILAAS